MTNQGTGNGMNRIIEAEMDDLEPLGLTDEEWLARPQVGKATLHAIKKALVEYRSTRILEDAVGDLIQSDGGMLA